MQVWFQFDIYSYYLYFLQERKLQHCHSEYNEI